MNLLNDKTDLTDVANPSIEQMEKEQQEYHLLTTFFRTRGLKLFAYNYVDGEISEVVVKKGATININVVDGRLIPVDFEREKCTVDGRLIYFESLNLNSAKSRVKKYRAGKIQTLSNLREPNPDGIKFF